eukprot:scaffold93709_cov54-Phaeocystis_antarctica.AAC.2
MPKGCCRVGRRPAARSARTKVEMCSSGMGRSLGGKSRCSHVAVMRGARCARSTPALAGGPVAQ